MRQLLAAVAVVVLVAACVDRDPAGLGPSYNINSPPPSARDITVMSQNLYVGANVDLVIQALITPDPSDDFAALVFATRTVQNTDFPARAQAIADQIARARPHAIGLQEVSQINVNLVPLGAPIEVNQDFLAILLAALDSRGLHYRVAAQVQNVVAEPLPGLVRLVDYDALLVDDRVSVLSASGQHFTFNVGPVAPGISLIRGWVRARVSIGGQPYTIISAHAEANLAGAPPGALEALRAAQVGEMVASVGGNERVVLMGDLNDKPGSPMYSVLQSAGFTDAWSALHPGTQGLTCCHASDLSDDVANFDQRIDYIFTRGFARDDGKIFGQVDRFGDVPADRLAGPAYRIWPSDHVGLIAALR